MKQTKTKVNIISVLGALTSVVFALILGFTFCASSINYQFGNNPSSTSAYLANQQYHIINDTLDNPVVFGEGTHNFEIAMQYSMPYDFDVCFQYSLSWSNNIYNETPSTDNVILTFVNRDNIITDGTYVYLANSVKEGSGKINFIAGVEFVDPNDENYYGSCLTISITNVKVIKKAESYTGEHYLYNGSKAAELWLKYKQGTADAQVLMSNYRQNLEKGVPYPGSRTAYKKSVINGETVTTWLGGNKNYAGIGMHIITGNKPIKLAVQIEGSWVANDSQIQGNVLSENSIKFNYGENWSNIGWASENLWEQSSYDYIVSANTSAYINILDNIEVTSANKNYAQDVQYDQYRLVVHKITINGSGVIGTNDLVLDYSASKLAIANSVNTLSSTLSGEGNYSQKDVSVVNASLYNNGLYKTLESADDQVFRTSVSLVNNTNATKKVSVNYKVRYELHNGNISLFDENNDKQRSEQIFTTNEAMKTNFTISSLVCSYYEDYSEGSATVQLEAFSSVNLLEEYNLGADVQSSIKGNLGDNYEVWTYIHITNVAIAEGETSSKLSIESSIVGNQDDGYFAAVSIKNNTNKVVEGVTLNNLMVNVKKVTYTKLTNEPANWNTYFWRYYKLENGRYSPLDKKPDDAATNYYQRSEEFTAHTITYDDADNVVLQPGDSIVVSDSIGLEDCSGFYVSGGVSAKDVSEPNLAVIVKNGKFDAFIVNNSEKSYYIRFSGNLDKDVSGNKNNLVFNYNNIATEEVVVNEGTADEQTITYNHYIGILRPNQIISIQMTSEGILQLIEEDGVFNINTLTPGGENSHLNWGADSALLMEKYFAFNKD